MIHYRLAAAGVELSKDAYVFSNDPSGAKSMESRLGYA